ncbi:MAG: T9SS type A sorting domain-containing protein [Chitinophagaceae bacterium]
MKNFTLIIFIATLSCSGKLVAQAPSTIVATPVATSVAKLEKFELTVTLAAGYTNAYDYDDISIRLALVAPGGRKDTVDAFFMQDYTLNTSNGNIAANGSGNFKIRYAPNEVGTWQYEVIAKNTLGTATSTSQSFQCTASSAKGFVRKNTTNYLNFDNNDQYIPVGQNQAWQQNNIYLNYKSWLQKLSDNKANIIRIWQAVWGLGIEWRNGTDGYTGLKKYKQTSAYYTDWLLEESKSKGIYIMFCINHHGMVSSMVNPNWNESPYNAANGGPCANTWDFFTNATAKSLHKNRLRYIVARWGYSPTIMSWELFNEVSWTDAFTVHKDEVKDWHIEMANYLKSIDVYKHLVTTSYGDNAYDPNTWNSPAIDFTQVHNYINSPNVENALAGVVADYITQYNKPALNGEFGIDPASSSLSVIDPNGIHIHNSIWATAFSGAMGAGMTWWWDTYIDPQNLYTHYKPLSEFIATLALKDDNYKKTISSSSGGGTSDLTLTPGVGFALAGATAFTIDAAGNISPSASQLSNYLFGSTFNTGNRAPPVFTVTYPVAGQFKVVTGGSTGTASKVDIYLDGTLTLDQVAAINTTYTINVPAGAHTIKVDNLGTDWISISNYTFTNIGSALNSYILKSADSKKAAGWVHNKKYNWQYVKDNGVPATVTGATLNISGMENGSYMVQFTNCGTGASTGTANAMAAGGVLAVPLPVVPWDIAITAVWGGVTPVIDLTTAKELEIYPNPVEQGKLYLSYNLQTASTVTIDVFDMKGNKVAVVFNGKQTAGNKLIEWNKIPGKVAPGVYFIRFMIGREMATRKITIYN